MKPKWFRAWLSFSPVRWGIESIKPAHETNLIKDGYKKKKNIGTWGLDKVK